LAVFAALSFPTAAFADGRVWAAGHLANLTTLRRGGVLGPGAELGLGVDLSEFFALSADVTASHHFPNEEDEIPGDRVLGASLGIRYNLDVFKYVPYVGVSATGYLDAPLVDDAEVGANAGAKLFLGIDWRFHRHWSVGFHGELHALLAGTSEFPVYTLVGLSGAYHFRW
jgi:hypothetical protein